MERKTDESKTDESKIDASKTDKSKTDKSKTGASNNNASNGSQASKPGVEPAIESIRHLVSQFLDMYRRDKKKLLKWFNNGRPSDGNETLSYRLELAEGFFDKLNVISEGMNKLSDADIGVIIKDYPDIVSYAACSAPGRYLSEGQLYLKMLPVVVNLDPEEFVSIIKKDPDIISSIWERFLFWHDDDRVMFCRDSSLSGELFEKLLAAVGELADEDLKSIIRHHPNVVSRFVHGITLGDALLYQKKRKGFAELLCYAACDLKDKELRSIFVQEPLFIANISRYASVRHHQPEGGKLLCSKLLTAVDDMTAEQLQDVVRQEPKVILSLAAACHCHAEGHAYPLFSFTVICRLLGRLFEAACCLSDSELSSFKWDINDVYVIGKLVCDSSSAEAMKLYQRLCKTHEQQAKAGIQLLPSRELQLSALRWFGLGPLDHMLNDNLRRTDSFGQENAYEIFRLKKQLFDGGFTLANAIKYVKDPAYQLLRDTLEQPDSSGKNYDYLLVAIDRVYANGEGIANNHESLIELLNVQACRAEDNMGVIKIRLDLQYYYYVQEKETNRSCMLTTIRQGYWDLLKKFIRLYSCHKNLENKDFLKEQLTRFFVSLDPSIDNCATHLGEFIESYFDIFCSAAHPLNIITGNGTLENVVGWLQEQMTDVNDEAEEKCLGHKQPELLPTVSSHGLSLFDSSTSNSEPGVRPAVVEPGSKKDAPASPVH